MSFTRCFGCMRELVSPGAVCPHCGYDNTNAPGTQENHALRCGTVLRDRYVVGKILGQGGFGVTYIAYDTAFHIRVCIKEFFPQGAMRDAARSSVVFWSAGNTASYQLDREIFYREARSLVGLRDVNSVVSVWDVFKENQTAYIVMDYVEGETLQKYLVRNKKPLGEREAFDLLRPVMEDLAEIHARGIIHRDIKPDNLMLRPDGKLVLLDWGSAKDLSRSQATEDGQSAPSQPESSKTLKVVTQGFSPIEQYSEEGEIGPWTDVHAMCATYYYCVKGRTPTKSFDRVSGKELDLSGFSPAIAKVLDKGLAIKPDERIRSMEELKTMLGQALTEKPKPAKISKKLLVGLCAVMLAVLVSVAFLYYRYIREPVYDPIQLSDGVYVGQTLKGTQIRNGTGTMTYSNGNEYVGEWENDMRSGTGTMTYSDGVYVGEWKDGKRNGKGTFTWKESGDVYVGDFVDDKRTGKGTFTWKESGNVYEGDWVNDKRTGKGTCTWGENTKWAGDVYVGDFVDNKRTGKGVYTWKSTGNVYEGDFVDGKQEGQGTFTWKNSGEVYVGEWRNNERTGEGTLTAKDGSVKSGLWIENQYVENAVKKSYSTGEYFGQLKGDTIDGLGMFTWKDTGNIYIGEWKDGKLHGKGTLTWKESGDVYVGDFADGKLHGKGTITWKESGDVYEGDWVDDKRTGKGTFTWKESGNVYEGDFVDGKRTGQGVYTWKDNGDVYVGDFVDDKRNGKGTYTWGESGDIYEGDFVDNKRNGKGTITWKESGNVYEGDWVDGKRHGQGTLTYADGTVKTGQWENDNFVG